jgi:DNA gyrase subunit A
MELGLIRKVDLDSEMQQSYLDYAMSVIVSRALPDVRDGLKPVQRRILYAMYDMGLRADAAYKKSARIVGEVLGKYHPHGDMAVYEAMARLAQDFSMRYPLVDGQGNFGSVDGDPPAAMRYTEARLSKVAMEILNQIDQNTVDFIGNFDQTLEEPTVLPAAIPNLLVNGATGIAVGMATNIPPHNMGEVVDALTYMLQEWERLDDLTIPDLMRFIQGPDFPTGGVILQEAGSEGLTGAYATGRGRITVQARAHMEEMVRGRNRIIVTELPYQVNKAALIERIAELVREGTMEGIADLRDESDRQGMRIVIELSKTADPEKILRGLYKHTPMQTTFGIIMLALVDNEPHLLTLKQALRLYLDHRLVVVRRRSEFELAKAKARAHILEGLLVALKNLDEIITLIRNSPDAETARQRLIKRFKLSEIQAQAILDLPLRRLAALERKKIEQEYKDVIARIKELEALLKSPKRMRQVVSDELQAMKQTYGDARRTLIVNLKEGASTTALLTTTDVTPAQTVWVGVTPAGRIARAPADELKSLVDALPPLWLIQANTHNTLYLVSNQGKAAAIPVHAVPEIGKSPEGVPFNKISPLGDEEPLAGLFALPPKNGEDPTELVLTVSRGGMVKKSAAAELPGPLAHTFALAKVNDGDELVAVKLTDGSSEILLATTLGMAIRFKEEEIRPMGLVAAGVGGIKLSGEDEVVDAACLTGAKEICLVASSGRGKRVTLSEFPVQGRYGQGVQAWKLTRDARLVGMDAIPSASGQAVLHYVSGKGEAVPLKAIPLRGRSVQGEIILKAPTQEQVIAVGFLPAGVESPSEPAKEPHTPRKAPSDGAAAKANGHVTAKEAPAPKRTRAAAAKAKAAPEPAAKSKAKPSAKKPAAPAGQTGSGEAKTAPAAAKKPVAQASEKPAVKGKAGPVPAKKTEEKPAPAPKVAPRKPKAAPAAGRTSTASSTTPKAPPSNDRATKPDAGPKKGSPRKKSGA